jgi:hypothetical protein
VGIPNFYGFGSGLVGGQRVRFLVLSRLGADIQKFFQSGDRPLPLATALNIAIQIIDSLGNANNTRAGFFFVCFFGGLECVGHSFADVAHL